MINVEKTITDNPFVDNLIYYSKYLALNCIIKDEDDALSHETPESYKAGETYIACIEGKAKYEMFDAIPEEILEKYITKSTNLDVFANNMSAFSAYLNSLGLHERTVKLNNVSKVAQTVYIDHYDIMTDYVKNLSETWLDDNKELYEKCKDSQAKYYDLFDALPTYTRKRILIQYLNNYEDTNIDDINSSLDKFQEYIDARIDDVIKIELDNISKAMSNVFLSHYEIMQERGYITKVSQNNWYDYITYDSVNKSCEAGLATYKDLYNLFPEDDLRDSLSLIMDESTINNIINAGLQALTEFFAVNDTNRTLQSILNKDMMEKYSANYHQYANTDIYNKCKNNTIGYYELYKYLPTETQKMVINTEIEEYTNTKVYSENKQLLNSYLNELPIDEANEIRKNITNDMMTWYVDNFNETNNYYRTLIGLSPIIDGASYEYEDTLLQSQIDPINYHKFGKQLINMIPEGIYPESHWYAPISSYDSYDIGILEEFGVLDAYVQLCKSTMYSERYSYFRFLGDNKINLYRARKAGNFELLALPTIDNNDMKDKFVDAYVVNRDYVIKTVYSDAYKFQSDYYNKFIIIFILVNTIMDILSGISDMLINRKVFDARCIKYLFESYGIPYYSEIPIKYQQAMLKNLNILLKYKSSTRNMVDICSLFGFSDIKVFGYYMLKEHVVDGYYGEYVYKEHNDISYDLDELYVIDDSNGKYKDANGVRYTKLLEYRNYREDKYLKEISIVNDDGEISKKKIINNAEDVYIMDKWNNAVTVAKNNKTGLYEEIGKAENIYHFIPLLETDYFYKIKDYDPNHCCYNDHTQEYFSKIGANTSEAALKFVKVPVNESLTDYKSDPEYISTYDEITLNDEGNTWDGGLVHEDLKEKIGNYEFNAVLSKYVSVETVTEMTNMAFQVSYFYNMIFDNYYSEDKLTVEIPYLKVGHKFKFMDIVCYLFALMYYYNGIKDNIMYSPTQILYVKGYNFNGDLNKVMEDTLAFTTKDEDGNILKLADRENIFDINENIKKRNYDYIKEFTDNGMKIKSFNLKVDIDALDKWLSQFQMSLDDFIVYDEGEAKKHGFDQVITLRNFYSLNNSFYQKDIFKPNLIPSAYNNIIKYAFDYALYEKQFINDINDCTHEYIIIKIITIVNKNDKKDDTKKDNNADKDTSGNINTTTITATDDVFDYYYRALQFTLGKYKYQPDDTRGDYKPGSNPEPEDPEIQITEKYMEVLDGRDEFVYIMDYNEYITRTNQPYVIYKKYHKVGNDYITYSPEYYTYDGTNYSPLVSGNIFIKDLDGKFIFAADHYYSYDGKTYTEITDNKYFYTDNNNYKILKFGDYYILIDGKYDLDPNNCYVVVEQDGVKQYVLVKDLPNYENHEVQPEDCYILHSDGHFINLVDTDFYRKQDDGTYKYDKEICYIRTDKVTNYYDPTDNPVIYYEKLTDYYDRTNYVIHTNIRYVKNSDGVYIPESDLIDPNNCYYKSGNKYYLVVENLCKFAKYKHPLGIEYNIIMNDKYDYNRYALSDNRYVYAPDSTVRYTIDSDTNYVIALSTTAKYEDTKSMIVTLNQKVNAGYKFTEDQDKYNPEKTDKIWDENDWFYNDPSYQDTNIGMNGENTWYYKKPEPNPVVEDEEEPNTVGSGYYLSAETYIGDTKLEKGIKYYMAMNVETNFSGQLQISCDADDSCIDATCRIYDVKEGVKFHVDQVFTANGNESPRVKFLVYNFKDYPIDIGDYIIISNMRFMKSFNKDYIPQDIPSYDKLQEIYKTNEAIYKYLITMMQNCSDYDTYQIYKKLYDSLMVSEYNKEAFKLEDGTYAKTYTDFLQTRDSVLYERLMYFLSLDEDSMHKEIADNIIEITYAIDDCVDTYSYGYLYSYFPAVSANYIQQYISKIINFFKSWKTHLLGINTIYKFDDPIENAVKILEDQQYRNKDFHPDHVYISHSAFVNPMDATDCAGHKYSDKYPDLVQISNRYSDKVNIDDRVRIIVRDANMIKYTDNYENIHLILNNDEIEASVDENGNLIVNDESGLSISIPNDLVLTTDENDNDVFGSQDIEDLTESSDILGGSKNE